MSTVLPKELSPLEIAPGLGLFSVIFFRYDVCDIDFYTEAAVGVAVRPARHAAHARPVLGPSTSQPEKALLRRQ